MIKLVDYFQLNLPPLQQIPKNYLEVEQNKGQNLRKNFYLLYNSITVKPIWVEEHSDPINLQAVYPPIAVDILRREFELHFAKNLSLLEETQQRNLHSDDMDIFSS